MLLVAHPAAQRYGFAIPDFSYEYSSAQDDEIVSYIENGRRILKEFYESDEFKRMEAKKEFKDAYNNFEKAHEKEVEVIRAKRLKDSQ
jgi:hypothetical protein